MNELMGRQAADSECEGEVSGSKIPNHPLNNHPLYLISTHLDFTREGKDTPCHKKEKRKQEKDNE